MSTTTTQTTTMPSVPVQQAAKSILSYEGGRPVHKIPAFADKYAERKWSKEQMAGAFRVFAKLGWADGTAGHISLRGMSVVSIKTGNAKLTRIAQILLTRICSGSVSHFFLIYSRSSK